MAKTKTPARFSPEELKLLETVISGVWDEVGYDCLTAIADEKGIDINRVTVGRNTVVEIALDASRPEEGLRRSRSPLVTEDFMKRWDETEYDEKKRIARRAFPYSSYGM